MSSPQLGERPLLFQVGPWEARADRDTEPNRSRGGA